MITNAHILVCMIVMFVILTVVLGRLLFVCEFLLKLHEHRTSKGRFTWYEQCEADAEDALADTITSRKTTHDETDTVEDKTSTRGKQRQPDGENTE